MSNFLPEEDLARVLQELNTSWNATIDAVSEHKRLQTLRKKKERDENKQTADKKGQNSEQQQQQQGGGESEEEKAALSKATSTDWLYTCNEFNSNKKVWLVLSCCLYLLHAVCYRLGFLV